LDRYCNTSELIKRDVPKHTLYCARYVIEELSEFGAPDRRIWI